MSSGGRPIIIAGGGIAGLTAALCLARRGFQIQLAEASPRFETVGAGIQLSPNATRILDRHGILGLIRPAAVQPASLELRDGRSDRLLARIPLGEAAARRWGSPYLVVHRARLIEALAEQARSEPSIKLMNGARVEAVQKAGALTQATIVTGGRRYLQDARLVIGADGVWSTLRHQVAGAPESRFANLTAWRVMIPVSGTDLPVDRVSAFLHSGGHLVAYPVESGADLNLVAITKGGPAERTWSGEGETAALTAFLRNLNDRFHELHAHPWTRWPLYESATSQAWRSDGLILIGDAAHAMLPFAAQGAAMAIEDGEALAEALAKSPDAIDLALRRYEAERRPRIARVIKRGRLNRLAWHATGPVALTRNLVLKAKGEDGLAADLDWLYAHGQGRG